MTKLTFPVFILKSLNICVSIIKIAMKRKLDTGHYPSLCRVEEDDFFSLERWGRPTMSLIKEDIVHRKRAGLKVTACSLIPYVAQWWHAWGSIHTDYMILDTVYAICSWYWAGNLICASNEMCHSLEQCLAHGKGAPNVRLHYLPLAQNGMSSTPLWECDPHVWKDSVCEFIHSVCHPKFCAMHSVFISSCDLA